MEAKGRPLLWASPLCIVAMLCRVGAFAQPPFTPPASTQKGQSDGNGSRPWQMQAASGVTIPFKTLMKGQYSGVRDPLQIVIQTQDEWEKFWKRHSSTEANPPPRPYVDFSTEMVVGVFLGEKSTGGYSVEITKAERSNSNLYIYYREKSPPRDAIVTQALTQPYYLARLAKYDNPLFLKEK